jgi:hypothetical protein
MLVLPLLFIFTANMRVDFKTIRLAERVKSDFFYYVLTRHYWNGKTIYNFFLDILDLNDIASNMLLVLFIPVALPLIFIIVGPWKNKNIGCINFWYLQL